MRTRIKLLMVTASVMIGAAGGRADAAVVVQKQSMSGSQAFTTFSGSATIACAGGGSGTVAVSGSLSGSQTITRTPGSPTTINNGVFVEVDNYSNSCTQLTFGFSDGGFANGFTPPNSRLNSAQVMGTASVQDFNSGKTISLNIDVVFQGVGALSAEKSHTITKTNGPFTITITRQASASRSADASGTIKVDGVDIDATFSSATMSSNANSTLTVTKN